jgi:hypothetical protein
MWSKWAIERGRSVDEVAARLTGGYMDNRLAADRLRFPRFSPRSAIRYTAAVSA